jgi:acetyl esterase/lipase
MLGSSRMVNMDQVSDCLRREWVVVVPNHRLCPQVNILDGPVKDCRDLLAWIYDGNLGERIDQAGEPSNRAIALDLDHVFAFGTSSGGTLALTLVSPWWLVPDFL